MMKAGTWLAMGAILLAGWGCKDGSSRSMYDDTSPLATAVSHEDWPEATRLVEAGANPDTTVYTIPVIFWALMQDDKALADKLDAKGAQLDIMIGDERMIDMLERSAAKDPEDKKSRPAIEWLEAHGVKRRP